jgi:CheY-like chemotaxis protein
MRSILIIDDHPDIRENIAEILTLGGYETFTAENGKKGVELAVQQHPELIICDIMMPELDGYGVLHLLRRNPDTVNIPFIFLSAKAEKSDFRKGMSMGADDYITKPFDDVELLNAIEMRFKKQDVLHGKYSQDTQGVTELLKDLETSGLLHMNWENYQSEQFLKKHNVYTEGKRPRFLYYLKSGKVKGFRTSEDGKEYITNLYSEGDFIGYHALLEDRSYDDSADALEESEVVMIPKDEFLNAVYNDMSIATKFIKLIAKNVKEKEERLLHLAYGSLRKRVAKALLDIHNKFNKGEAGNNNTIDVSRDDLAHFVGTATESLIRTLSDFKSEQLIEIREGKVRILQPGKLANLLY